MSAEPKTRSQCLQEIFKKSATIGLLLDVSGSMRKSYALDTSIKDDGMQKVHAIITSILNIVKQGLHHHRKTDEIFASAFGLSTGETLCDLIGLLDIFAGPNELLGTLQDHDAEDHSQFHGILNKWDVEAEDQSDNRFDGTLENHDAKDQTWSVGIPKDHDAEDHSQFYGTLNKWDVEAKHQSDTRFYGTLEDHDTRNHDAKDHSQFHGGIKEWDVEGEDQLDTNFEGMPKGHDVMLKVHYPKDQILKIIKNLRLPRALVLVGLASLLVSLLIKNKFASFIMNRSVLLQGMRKNSVLGPFTKDKSHTSILPEEIERSIERECQKALNHFKNIVCKRIDIGYIIKVIQDILHSPDVNSHDALIDLATKHNAGHIAKLIRKHLSLDEANYLYRALCIDEELIFLLDRTLSKYKSSTVKKLIMVTPSPISQKKVHKSNTYKFAKDIIKIIQDRIQDIMKQALKSINKPKTWTVQYVSVISDKLNLKPTPSHNSSLQSRIKSLINQIEPYIYGCTPMCAAMRNALHIFQQSAIEKRVLFILSDGLATDGDPCQLGSELAKLGVTIVTCFLTNEHINNPRSLFDTESDAWDNGKKKLFRLSAVMRNIDPPVSFLTDHGWTLPASGECRLFFQANSLNLVDELCKIVVAELPNPCDALLDVMEKVFLGTYINQKNAAFEPVKQVGGTCYAHAVATVLHLAMHRIVGREGGYPEFQKLKDCLVAEYGKDGASVRNVLEKICPKYRLHFQEVDEVHARQALNCRRPLVATFFLRKKQWDKFGDFFRKNPKGILQRVDIGDGSNGPKTKGDGGHAVVLTRCSPGCLQFINSWGQTWAHGGFFKVKEASVLDKMTFYDVYWTLDDLKQSEKDAYQREAAQLAKELAEAVPSVRKMPFTCPCCKKTSHVRDFQGDLIEAICPKCNCKFRPINEDLVKSLYVKNA